MNSNAKPVETGLKRLLPVQFEIQRLNVPNAERMKAENSSQCLPPGHNQAPEAFQPPDPDLPEAPPAVRETANEPNLRKL